MSAFTLVLSKVNSFSVDRENVKLGLYTIKKLDVVFVMREAIGIACVLVALFFY